MTREEVRAKHQSLLAQWDEVRKAIQKLQATCTHPVFESEIGVGTDGEDSILDTCKDCGYQEYQ